MTNNSFLDPRDLSPVGLNKEDRLSSINEPIAKKEELGTLEAFIGGIKHSGLVSAMKMSYEDTADPDATTYYTNQDEDRYIFEKLGWDMSAYKAVVRGLKSKDDIDSRIKTVKENIDYQNQLADEGFFTGLVSGIGDAIVDPTNWVGAYKLPVFLGKGLTKSIANTAVTGAITNVASGRVRETLSGADSDIMTDALSGALFGGAFELARGTKSLLGEANRRFEYTQNQMRMGLPVSEAVLNHLGGNKTPAPYLDKAREWLNEAIPAFNVSEVLYRDEATRTLAQKLFRRNQGTLKEVDGKLVNVEVESATPTIEERLQVEQNTAWEFQSLYADTKSKMMQLGMTDDEFNITLYNLLEGRLTTDVDLVSSGGKGTSIQPEMIELAKEYRKLMDSRGDELVARGFLSNKKANYGAPRVMDKTKVYNFLRTLQEKLGIYNDDPLLRIKAIEKVENALVEGARKNRNTLKELYDRFASEFKESSKKEGALAPSKGGKTPSIKNAISTEVWEVPPINSKEFDTWLKENAHRDAIGYIDQNESAYGIDTKGNFVAKYDHERLAWDTSYMDAEGFSLDSLRLDPADVFRNYWNHTSGDIVWYDELGLMGYDNVSNYMQTTILKNKTSRNKAQDSKLRRALKTTLNLTYGISPKEHFIGQGVSRAGAVAEIFKNTAFFTKNGFMGLLNHTEIAEGVKAYGAGFMLRSVPWIRNKFKNWSNGKYTQEDMTAINNSLFGEEVKNIGIFQNSWSETKARAKYRYQEIERRNKDRYDTGSLLRKIASGTQWLAEVSPATRYLQHSQKSIVDEARSQFMGELVRTAHGLKKGHKGFFNEKDLKRNSISDAQADHLIQTIKKATKVNADGSIEFTDFSILTKDTNAMMTLRRMGDYVSNNVIQRNTMGDAFYWADKNNPMLDLILQFKTFAINSWTKRALRMINRGFESENEAIEQFLIFSISGGLSSFSHIGITYMRAMGIEDEEQRNKYLERQLGFKDGVADLDSDSFITILWNGGFQRNGITAFPALAMSLVGNREAKTTSRISFDDDEEKKTPLGRFDTAQYIGDLVPAVGTVDSLVNFLRYTYDMTNIDEYTPKQQERLRRNQKNAFKNSIPNYPFVSDFFISLASPSKK